MTLDWAATAELLADLSGWLHQTYPGAVLVPESDIEAPVDLGLRSAFHADFFLVNQAAHSACSTTAAPARCGGCPTTSCASSTPTARRSRLPRPVPALWDEHIAGNGPDRRVILATADHDFSRLYPATAGPSSCRRHSRSC